MITISICLIIIFFLILILSALYKYKYLSIISLLCVLSSLTLLLYGIAISNTILDNSLEIVSNNEYTNTNEVEIPYDEIIELPIEDIDKNSSPYLSDKKIHEIRQMIDITEGSDELHKSIAMEYLMYLPESVIDTLIENNLKIYVTPNAKESFLNLTGYDFDLMEISGVFNFDENTRKSIICVNEDELWWSLYHEIGHAFDCFNEVDGNYRSLLDDNFHIIFNKEKEEVIQDPYMYEYISNNVLEYFAEAFRYYCENIYNSSKAGLEVTLLDGETFKYIDKLINSQ